MLSPTTELLIYLEHNTQASIAELKKWRSKSFRGIIGKLEAQTLIKKIKSNNKSFYKLTDRGLQYLDSILENLHKKTAQVNRWTIVIFSIPEKERSKRDKLRRYLQKRGFGSLYGSTWILPSKPGTGEKIHQYASQLNISQNVIVLDGVGNPNDNRKIVAGVWNLKKISYSYKDYIKRAKAKIKTLKKNNPDTSFEAKKLIFDLASIISTDPNLPSNQLPNDWPKDQAIELYQEIRKKIT